MEKVSKLVYVMRIFNYTVRQSKDVILVHQHSYINKNHIVFRLNIPFKSGESRLRPNPKRWGPKTELYLPQTTS